MKLILVSGPNNSGKSCYAEQLVAQITGSRFYIATMRPCTEQNHRRIQKHRQQRSGLGFQTLECPHKVGDVSVLPGSVVLLEDVSNLLANAMFEKDRTASQVYDDICRLAERCRLLVAVTIAGLEGRGYDSQTAAYIDALNELNGLLFEKADAAITMHNNTPICQKGDIHDLV